MVAETLGWLEPRRGGLFVDATLGLGGPDEGGIAGVLADLGVSSLQLETAGRGFSFRLDGPLDMRMGMSDVTAADLVNETSEGELERIIREYGEEWQARRIVRAIARARTEKTTETT